MFQVFFVGIPTVAAVWNSALPRFLVLSSLTFLLCMIILGTMFLPKIYRNRFGVESSFNGPTRLQVDDDQQRPNGPQASSGHGGPGLNQETTQALQNDVKVIGKPHINTGHGTTRARNERFNTEGTTIYRRSHVEGVLDSIEESAEEQKLVSTYD